MQYIIAMPLQATSAGGANSFVPSLKKNEYLPGSKELGGDYYLPGGQRDSADNEHFLPKSFDASLPKQFDEAEYFALRVAIFDEHNGVDENLDIDFTPEILQQIVDKCKSRIKNTGDYAAVTDGHTGEDIEPDVLGYAVDFDVDDFHGKSAIYATLALLKSKAERIKQLKRRSVELWPDAVIDPVVLKSPIDSVALLGSERPARDLGLMDFNKRLHRYSYELTEEHMDSSSTPMGNDEVVKKAMEAMMSMPEWQYAKECLEKAKMQVDNKPEEKDDKPMDEENKDMHDEEEEHGEDVDPAKLRMQRDQSKRRYAKLESEYQTLFSKVAELERKERVADRKSTLLQLEAEGYDFEMAEELEYVSDMEPAKFSAHLNKMRKNYRKAPIGINIRPATPPVEGGSPQNNLTPDEVYDQAIKVAHARYNGKS